MFSHNDLMKRVVLFYTLEILLNVWLHKKQLNSHICIYLHLHSVCFNMLFWLK